MIPDFPTTRSEAYLAKICGEDVELPEPQTRTDLFLAAIAGADVTTPEPRTRSEIFLASILGQSVELPAPQSRLEIFLAKIAGLDVVTPEPQTRLEMYLDEWAQGGGAEYETVTGAIASFTTLRAAPLKELLVNIDPVQSGSGDPAPDNVRPISGHTGVNVWRTGKNLYPYEGDIPGYEYSWYANASYASAAHPVFLKGGKVYCISAKRAEEYSNWFVMLRVFDANKNVITDAGKISGIGGGSPTFTYEYVSGGKYFKPTGSGYAALYQTFSCTEDCYIDMVIQSGKGTGADPMIEIVSSISDTPSDFAAYVGTTIPITIPTPPGTVYGGTLDVLTGVLTVDRISAQLTGTAVGSSWASADTNRNSIGFYNNGLYWAQRTGLPNPSTGGGVFDYCKTGSVYANENIYNAQFLFINNEFNRFEIRLPKSVLEDYSTESSATESAKDYLDSHPLQAVYYVEPTTYQLTPEEVINTLQGANVIWADTGIVTVTYRSN